MERKVKPSHVIMENGYCIEKINNNLYSVINEEMNIDIEVKIEETEDFETDLINLNPEADQYETNDTNIAKELYWDHDIIKEEMVIGPEQIQPNSIRKPFNLHGNIQNNQSETYQCSKCKENFKTKRSLFSHSKNRHDLKICQFCNKAFNKTSNLNRHENYSCPNNESVARNNEVLKYGMYAHPFICDYCNKSYTHKNTLKNHIKIHMCEAIGELRSAKLGYQCKLCDKSYTKKHNLTCHVRSTHLNVKSYSCRFCNKKFAWRFSAASHEKTHHKVGS